MKILRLEFTRSFRFENFKKSFKITWLYLGLGLLLFLIFLLFAGAMPRKSFFYYFLQNVGIFLLFANVLMAYSGVFIITKFPEGAVRVTRTSIREVAGKAHYIFGISTVTVVLIGIVVFIEVGVSSISYVPYAGPVIVALLTIPMFLINFLCLIFAICIFAILPPVVGDSDSLRDILNHLKSLLKKYWVTVVIYLVISLSILFLSMILIYFLAKYSVGITKGVQWKISAAYPQIMKTLSMKSYLSDLIFRITPRPDSASAFRQYGFKIFKYLDLLKYIITFSYLVVFSFIVSFPLAAYFNLSSAFFKALWKKSK